MFDRMLTKTGMIGLALVVGIWATPDVFAQTQGRRGQQPPPRQDGRQQGMTPQGQQPQQQSQQQPQQMAESEPFIHGLYLGFGVSTYHGDLDGNPSENPIGFLGNATLRVTAGADHRLGEYDQFGVATRLSFEQVDGAARGWGPNPRNPLKFDADLLNLVILGEYELPYIQQGFARVFVGGGPSLIINPTYSGFPSDVSEEYQSFFRPDLGTRVTGQVTAGVTLLDSFQIGVRIYPSDFVDGYEGFNNSVPDIVGFVSFGHRFDFKY